MKEERGEEEEEETRPKMGEVEGARHNHNLHFFFREPRDLPEIW